MARTFDGVDDQIQCSIGACTGAGTGFGTFAIICRRAANGTGDTLIALEDNASLPVAFELNSSNLFTFYNGVSTRRTTFTVLTANGWHCLVYKKATGTVTGRFGKYQYSNDTWTFEDATDGTQANWATGLGAGSKVTLGAFNTGGPGNFFSGDIAIAAFWGGTALTDDQCRMLPHDLMAWFQVQPTGLWLLDQSVTTDAVADMTGGGANQSSLTGTTVATSSAPFGYGAPSMGWEAPTLGPAGGGGGSSAGTRMMLMGA